MPAVTQNIKWENHLCFSVGGKMFLITSLDEYPITASIKVSEEEFYLLVNKTGFKAAPYLGRYQWIFLSDINLWSDKQWENFIVNAYTLIASKLPTKMKKTINFNSQIDQSTGKSLKKSHHHERNKQLSVSLKLCNIFRHIKKLGFSMSGIFKPIKFEELTSRVMDYFISLPLVDKKKFLWENGRYVLTTDFYGARVKLFSLHTSFVEVYYHPVERRVMRISIANDTDLSKHLKGIKVSFNS